MLYRGPTPSQPGHSEDGVTYYRHGGTICARSRSRPTIVRSNAAVSTRNLISVLSILWENPLTNMQRAAWGNYAFNTPVVDAYGSTKFFNGYAHFMRANRPRLQHGLPYIADAPTTFGIPPGFPPAITYDRVSSNIAVAFDRLAPWASQLGSAMLFWISRPQPRARTKPPETYSILGRINGAVTPPPSPATFMVVLPSFNDMSANWLRSAVTYADGSYSATIYPTPDSQKQLPPPTPPPPPAPDCNDTTTIATVTGGTWTRDRLGTPVIGAPIFPANCPWIGPCFWQVLIAGRWLVNVTPVGGPGNPTARIRADDTAGPPQSEWQTFDPQWWSAVYTSSTGHDSPTNLNLTIHH